MHSAPHDAGSLAAQLAEEICDLAPGTRLPSEKGLAERFDVSRATVRKALADLESRLLITRVRGRGTFVPHRLDLTFSNRTAPSMHALVSAAGRTLSTSLLDSRECPLPAHPAALLHAAPGTPALNLTRLGTIDALPFSYASEWILPNRTHDLDVALSVYKSVYSALVAFGFTPRRASTTASVADMPPAAREHLRVDRPMLGWNVTTLTIDEDSGAPVMASTTWLRMDAADITVTVDPPGP